MISYAKWLSTTSNQRAGHSLISFSGRSFQIFYPKHTKSPRILDCLVSIYSFNSLQWNSKHESQSLDQIILISFTTSLLNLVIGTNLCHQMPPPRPCHPERRDALWWSCSEPPPRTRCKNNPYTTHLPEIKQNSSQFFFGPYSVHPRKQILFNMSYSPIVSAATDPSNIFFLKSSNISLQTVAFELPNDTSMVLHLFTRKETDTEHWRWIPWHGPIPFVSQS